MPNNRMCSHVGKAAKNARAISLVLSSALGVVALTTGCGRNHDRTHTQTLLFRRNFWTVKSGKPAIEYEFTDKHLRLKKPFPAIRYIYTGDGTRFKNPPVEQTPVRWKPDTWYKCKLIGTKTHRLRIAVTVLMYNGSGVLIRRDSPPRFEYKNAPPGVDFTFKTHPDAKHYRVVLKVRGKGKARLERLVVTEEEPDQTNTPLALLFALAALISCFLFLKVLFPAWTSKRLLYTRVDRRHYASALYVVLLMIYSCVLIRNAWLCDDAYITLRTVDNFVHGYGLTWNVAERVQVYTHPLWMFVMTLFYSITSEAFYTTLTLSIVTSIAAVLLVGLKISRDKYFGVLLIAFLISSKAFIDYSTSGLENPLTHLLIAAFVYYHLQFAATPDPRRYLKLCLVGSLMVLNRMDTALIIAPALLSDAYVVARKKPWWRPISLGLLGFSPFVLWLVFSTIYYGYPFPNTAYAKLNTNLSQGWFINQALYYYLFTLKNDPITFVVILLPFLLYIFKRTRQHLVLLIGILLNLLYVLKIGGGFMGGRFFTVSFFTAICILASHEFEYSNPSIVKNRLSHVFLASVVVIAVGLTFRGNPILADKYYSAVPTTHGVSDERGGYYGFTGLLNARVKEHLFAKAGMKLKRKSTAIRKRGVFLYGGVGMAGYYAGPYAYIVDTFCLTDPLRSHIPRIVLRDNWRYHRIGHFKREIPAGYLASLKSRSNRINNPALREYYDKVLTITRGKIFSLARFKTIAKMNTGAYRPLITRYLATPDSTTPPN